MAKIQKSKKNKNSNKTNEVNFKKILNHKPFIHKSSSVFGDVLLAQAVSLWPNTVLRGDFGSILLGRAVNIQDRTVIHVEPKGSCEIGDYTLVGHGAMLHGCKIGRACLIGINSLILDDAEIGDGCIITAGVMIRGKKKIPPFSLVAGQGDNYKVYEGKARPKQVIEASLLYALNAYNYKKKKYHITFTEDLEKQLQLKAEEIYKELFPSGI